MVAFAGNSLLCRGALNGTKIDAASFTSIRLLSGAAMLLLLLCLRSGRGTGQGSWFSASALFIYAAGFSFAYISLPTATGALLLFGAVQITMIVWGLWRGECLGRWQVIGFAFAFIGLVVLLLPGLSAPPLFGSVVMLAAGVAWGIYSLRAKGAEDPTRVTAGNFLRAVPMALLLSFVLLPTVSLDLAGVGYAVASGAAASGLGYALWYQVLPNLPATSAASLQLTVPVLAGLGGILLLGEALTLRLTLASFAIVGGVAMVVRAKTELRR